MNIENIQLSFIDNGEESSVGDIFSLSDDTVIAEKTVQVDINYTYASLNELGAMIVSFPQLEEWIKLNFVCKNLSYYYGPVGVICKHIGSKTENLWNSYGIGHHMEKWT